MARNPKKLPKDLTRIGTVMHKLHEDQERFHTLSLDTEQYLDLLDPHIGELAAMNLPKRNMPIAEHWSPVNFKLNKNNEGATEIPDWSFYTAGNLILNERAKTALESLLVEAGEILPLKTAEEKYYFFNCLIKFEHEQAMPKDKHLFKASPSAGIDLICSDTFALAVKNADLKGMYFTNDVEAPV